MELGVGSSQNSTFGQIWSFSPSGGYAGYSSTVDLKFGMKGSLSHADFPLIVEGVTLNLKFGTRRQPAGFLQRRGFA